MTAAPLLLHVFPTFGVGGSQSRLAAIANHFGRRYRHAIVAMDGVYDCFGRLAANLDVGRWEVPVRKGHAIRNVTSFRQVLTSRSPDLLITYNWGAIEWAMANHPRIVPHVHIEDGFGPEEAKRQLWRRVLGRRFSLARSTVVVPSLTLHRIALNKWHLSADRVRHIPNGIECARFLDGSSSGSTRSGQRPTIGTVAALRPEKNIGRLLRAFRSVLEDIPCRLMIAGDGPERGNLEEFARGTLPAESVVFTGHIEEVERVYACFDIFALSSDTEQMPTSLMEAMAAGLPVVATDVGDVPEMIGAPNRPFIVRRDDLLFADSLRRLVADPTARKTIGAANRAAAEANFSIARMFSRYDSLFQSLVHPGSATSSL